MEDYENNVQSIMTTDLVTVLPEALIIDVSRLMLEKKIRCVLVCDNDRNLRGIVTDSDLVFGVAGRADDALQNPISEIMSIDPIVVDPNADIYDVVAIMSDRGFRRVPVTSNGKAVGIVSIRDIVRNILKNLGNYSTTA
jgi:CBS domain-containing protein